MRNKVFLIPNNFFFILALFYIGYYITFFFPGYFQGTDSEFYIQYLENPYFDFSFEPLFSFLSFSIGLFFDGESGYHLLGLISLTIKAYFLSRLLVTQRNKILIAIIFVIFYFLIFFNRQEIGSLRNAYGIDILQFILLVKSLRSILFVSILSFTFHYSTGFFALTLSSYLNVLNLFSTNSFLIFKGIFERIIRFRIKIPTKINIRFIYALLIFMLITSSVFFYKERILNSILMYFLSGQLTSIRYFTINPLTYYRFYIILFTLVGIYFVYRLRITGFNHFIINKIDLTRLQNHIDIVAFSLLFVFFCSFLPIVTVVQRVSYISIYFCCILNFYYGTNIFFLLIRKLRVNIFIFIAFIFFSCSLLVNSLIIYKYIMRNQYELNVESRNIESRNSDSLIND